MNAMLAFQNWLLVIIFGTVSLLVGCNSKVSDTVRESVKAKEMEKEMEEQALFTLSPEAIKMVISDSLVSAGADYVEANPQLSAVIKKGIGTNALYRGMTIEEASFAIGKIERVEGGTGSIYFRFPFEGLQLQFDSNGLLNSVVEQ